MPSGRKLTNESFKSIMRNKCNWQLNNTPMQKMLINNDNNHRIWNTNNSFDALNSGVSAVMDGICLICDNGF